MRIPILFRNRESSITLNRHAAIEVTRILRFARSHSDCHFGVSRACGMFSDSRTALEMIRAPQECAKILSRGY